MITIPKPNPGEHAPYAIKYIDLVDHAKPIIQQLEENLKSTISLLKSYTEEQLSTPCADGEWTIKEILNHNMDTERVFCYRALRFSRKDTTELAGFEQDDYVANSKVNECDIESLLEEYAAMRHATITFFKNLPEETLTCIGISNGKPLSVRAAAWMIVGHEIHHINSINENYPR